MPKLTPDQIRILKRISDPEIKRKYTLYYQLPQKVQDILFATKTAERIREIILKHHKLSHEQLWIGSYITGTVLLGITPLKGFSEILEEKLGVAPDIAQAIARDINEQIFAEISEELKEIHKEKAEPSPIRPPEVHPPEIPSGPESPSKPEEVKPRIKGNVVDLKGE